MEDLREAEALMASGAVLQRHAHQMRLVLPVPSQDEPEFHPFRSDGEPPVPWVDALPSFLSAYPPSHPDHLPGGEELIDTHLVLYTRGAELGPLIHDASAIAVRDGRPYGGVVIVDRPGEGAWVCELWRDPDPVYAGRGAAMLRWAASRLSGRDELGLVVTVGNDAALRAYERVGFVTVKTAWRLRQPD